MKKFLNGFGFILALVLTSQMAIAQKNKMVVISGKLAGFNNQVDIQNFSEYQYLLPPSSERLIVPDAEGNFKIQFKVESPNYYRLGRNVLYLSPGDNLNVFIDYKDSKNATFEGVGAEANRYLRGTPFPKGGSFIEAGRLVKPTIAETFVGIDAAAEMRRTDLSKVRGISDEFRRLETARIKADLIKSFETGRFYSIYRLKLKGDTAKVFETAYDKAVAPIVESLTKNFADASLLKVEVYRDITDEIIKNSGKESELKIIKDFQAANELVGKMQKEKEKSAIQAYSSEINKITTAGYKVAAQKMASSLLAFGKGDLAIDFTVLGQDGKQIKLSSLKGKVLYIDLWATWCGPCMQEMPEFEKLKARYKGNSQVAFISLSIDDDHVAWTKSVKSRNADGYQWIINRQKLMDYNIVGIPRVLLINKNFKVANMSASSPSNKNVVKEINDLLK